MVYLEIGGKHTYNYDVNTGDYEQLEYKHHPGIILRALHRPCFPALRRYAFAPLRWFWAPFKKSLVESFDCFLWR